MRELLRNKTVRKSFKRMLAIILVLIITLTSVNLNSFMKVKASTEYKTLYFIDNTAEQWIKNDSAVMQLVDNTNGHDSYWMTQKDDVTWCVNVPESAYNITFNRYSSDKSTKWNSWSAGGRDENNAYYADGAEYGHWDVEEGGENYFHAGDIIYLDLSEFSDWEKDNALMYINFSDASKEENGGNDISISNADKSLYEPQKVSDKLDEYVYQYIFTEDSEGAVNLRFWRGNSDTLWNYSLVLSYEEYLDGINCIKVKDWDNAGVILAHNIEIDIEKDSDNDGLSDDYEDKIGTNKAKKDTDNDGLSDYIEVSLGYSPVLSDTDDDGIIDGEEDFEGDGLTNKEEVNIGTDISWWDTDDDGLDDYDEINNYYTLPLMEDTDSDGIVDGIEVKFGLNPLEKDSNGDGIEDALEKITYLFDAKLMIDDYDKNVYPQVGLSGDIKTLDSFEISIKENNYIINQRIPGYIGNAYEFTTESEFESAKVTFYIEPSLFEDENFLPAIYYFNEEEQFFEIVDNQIIEGNTVSADLEHFSTYIVLNKKKFDEVWETEIAYFDDDEIEKPFDIAFVIDASGSMSTDKKIKNDKDGLRLKLSKEMVKKLEPQDRAMVIKFNLDATLLQTLTDDKELITSAIDEVDSYSLTAMFDGIHLANSTYALESDDNHRKIMIVITDGIDNYSIYSANTVINEAKANDVKIYTIGLGSQIDETVLKRIASETGGKYYYAAIASDLEDVYDEIEDETIDYETDSNNDGISDYYTKLLCEGKMGTGTGVSVFEGIPYEDIQKNDDYDGDGLKNGDELEVKRCTTCVYVKMNSNPKTGNSDNDIYSDFTETKVYYTNPMEENLLIERDVIELLVDGDSYYAGLYEEEYRKSNKKQVCTWIGNNIYGSNDEVQIYEQALIDYFKTINLGFVTEIEGRERIEMLLQYMGIVGSVVDEARISLKNDDNAIDELLELEKQIETLKISIIDAANSSNGFTKADFYEQYDILQGYLADASKKSDDIKAALNKNVTVKGKIMTFAQGKDATVGAKTLVWTSNILQVGMDCMEEYDDYISLKANMETLQENIYILEILSESAYNENVKKAASSLLSVARTEYINLEKEILDAFGSGVLNLVLHELISKVPVVGFWVELGLSLGSIIIPLSDVSQCAVRVCGDSCMATILAADLKNYLSRDINKILTSQEIYVVDSNSINEVIKKYINLVEMRKFGENDMIELQKSGAGIVKWLLNKSGHDTEEIISECETTIEYLEWLKGLYSFKSFQKSNG